MLAQKPSPLQGWSALARAFVRVRLASDVQGLLDHQDSLPLVEPISYIDRGPWRSSGYSLRNIGNVIWYHDIPCLQTSAVALLNPLIWNPVVDPFQP
eukprot:CAMPEP_0184301536 /NCGR_PEP_ID=MMETSP1049-20130417/11716_1 /TAXON_ID=77928 /ORGANISM="Proteomonas sulcata, Strain CCMP704" /LENGTH=96 /DNA_ID=CAMNT_0026612565 /DNA_START=396 /DNA_END=683 /DNA_ORIENTATION=-